MFPSRREVREQGRGYGHPRIAAVKILSAPGENAEEVYRVLLLRKNRKNAVTKSGMSLTEKYENRIG